jgi:hypothetical protein
MPGTQKNNSTKDLEALMGVVSEEDKAAEELAEKVLTLLEAGSKGNIVVAFRSLSFAQTALLDTLEEMMDEDGEEAEGS